jgi:uncharacterized protein YdbL (DUF1318 family)
MSFTRFPLVLVLGFFMTACVTINVYFPAAAAEKAADQIIDKVWGEEDKKSEESPSKSDQNQKTPAAKPAKTSQVFSMPWMMAVENWFIAPVHAAEADLDISSPDIEALQSSLAKRFKQLSAYYASGAVGLTNDGLVELRDASLVPLNARAQLNKLIQGENSDRQNLYSEIASANSHPEWAGNIQKTFAKRWIDRAQKGWWYQTPKGEWKQK